MLHSINSKTISMYLKSKLVSVYNVQGMCFLCVRVCMFTLTASADLAEIQWLRARRSLRYQLPRGQGLLGSHLFSRTRKDGTGLCGTLQSPQSTTKVVIIQRKQRKSLFFIISQSLSHTQGFRLHWAAGFDFVVMLWQLACLHVPFDHAYHSSCKFNKYVLQELMSLQLKCCRCWVAMVSACVAFVAVLKPLNSFCQGHTNKPVFTHKWVSLTLMRTSLAWGGATSISSITKGFFGSQATAALHLMI